MVDVDSSLARHGEPPAVAIDLIELMFFGYRDFVGVADAALSQTDYGRAHHRILHFVDRNPGLTMGELLAILKVTKQAASRVTRTLIEDGLIEARAGEADRREKRLRTTPRGHALAADLIGLQSRRIEAALAGLGPDGRRTVAAFLAGLVDEDERPAVLGRILDGGPADAAEPHA